MTEWSASRGTAEVVMEEILDDVTRGKHKSRQNTLISGLTTHNKKNITLYLLRYTVKHNFTRKNENVNIKIFT